MDPRSSCSTSMTSAKKNKPKGNENESKGVQFSEAELPLIKFIGTANQELPEIHPTHKNSAFVPQEHQIRMRSDERNKGIHRSAHSRGDGGLVEGLQLG